MFPTSSSTNTDLRAGVFTPPATGVHALSRPEGTRADQVATNGAGSLFFAFSLFFAKNVSAASAGGTREACARGAHPAFTWTRGWAGGIGQSSQRCRESRNGAAKLRSAETGVFRPHLTRGGTHVRLERAEASASRHRERCQTRSRRTARTGPRGRTTGADALTFRAQETADLEKFCKRAANGRNRYQTEFLSISQRSSQIWFCAHSSTSRCTATCR